MNIVKGVADLIRRSSGGQSGDFGSPSQRLSPPGPFIRFSDVGDEAVLNTLWERYEKTFDKVEKRKLFHIFLKQFLIVYREWRPVYLIQSSTDSHSIASSEYSQHYGDMVVGCSVGHPGDIILALTEEVAQVTALLSEYQSGTSTSMTVIHEVLPLLDVLIVISRSIHNCRVFGFYGGIQKLTALMKAAVVQLKTIASALSADETLPNTMLERTTVLQNILVLVVSVIHSFVDLHSELYEKARLKDNDSSYSIRSSGTLPSKAPLSETMLRWHQKAVLSVMEAGGLNWLVELLRVMKRLSLREQRIDISLQYLTLRTLLSALANNPRGQNHFRSIGGLEVLLDGLGISSNNSFTMKDYAYLDAIRSKNIPLSIFQLHVLLLEVLREAVFGNLNNLQFLSENGRVHKFANSFCSLAFMLQEYNQQNNGSFGQDDSKMLVLDEEPMCTTEVREKEPLATLTVDVSGSPEWNDYVSNLSTVLCSFLLASEETTLPDAQISAGQSALLVSSAYMELSVKWVTRVLITVFPCIKACSNQSELPRHLRIFVYTLQHHVLALFKKVLLLSPSLLDTLRTEGVWDFIFSENFFYFDPVSEFSGENIRSHDLPLFNMEPHWSPIFVDGQVNRNEVDVLQIEVISLMEFAATLDRFSHNEPECSILLDALEQCACNPEIAGILAKSLLRILQLSAEKTVSSFKTLSAIPRVLKVTCIQVQESRRLGIKDPCVDIVVQPTSPKMSASWQKSIETSMEIFALFFSSSDDARNSVLHSSACVDCLFDLFWEEGLRNRMLAYIIDLMKILPLSEEDRKSKYYLCSKYLETFTRLKECERSFTGLSIDLMVGLRDMVAMDRVYYQTLFCEGECFLHIVSLLNGNIDVEIGGQLLLNVLQTLTSLLSENDSSKAAFRALVGKGYQTLQSLLLDFCQWQPSEALLSALLDMLVDGKFDPKASSVIKNEDAIMLYLCILQKSSDSLQQYGLNVFLQLLRDCISNRASCVRAGMLNFLLDWFAQEDSDAIVLKISQLVQVIGGHSISGKDIRKIFALLRSEKVGSQQKYCSLLLNSMLSMLNEKGPTAFFDLNGINSGVLIKTPVQWPLSKGFSFTCWLRVESFPRSGSMGLFNFLTENGRGCFAVLAKDTLIYESINQKRQSVSLHVNLVRKKWHFLCLTHTIGRPFSGGSQLRCYLDGTLVSSEKCRYAKVNEPLTNCAIGTKINLPLNEEENAILSIKDSSPFLGQIGPLYLFCDAISSEQVQGIHSLGPSYMYSFLDNEIVVQLDHPLPGGVLDAKDGLASRIIFGLNAQASNGKILFNVSSLLDQALDKNIFEAYISVGTQLCSRRLLQQIIYCVGGVSVFFPLFTQSELYDNTESEIVGQTLLTPLTRERLTAEIIELIASVLDENLSNQQQMLLLSGFSILGFLLQSVPPQQLNLETLSALRHLFNVVANCGLSELLVKDAISYVFLNPHIWVCASYKVQRELYMFLIQQFDNDPRLLKSLCTLPRVLDIIRQFYWDDANCCSASGARPLLDPITNLIVGERPSNEEVHKIRLLLLSLGEMSLRQQIAVSDVKALIAFFETSQDMACIEDVLHMVIRAVSQKSLLASFLEQVDLVGGCHIFVNLLQRDFEPIRLLSLQFLGRLLVGLPSEKKGSRFFNIAVGRSKSLSEGPKKISLRMQPIFSVISDRLFKFPQTDLLCATLFDVLLGGASPKQVLQKQNQLDRQRSSRSYSQFFVPQVLVLIFRFLSSCEDPSARMKIIRDLLDLLDSNPSNIESLMEYGWNAWLVASVKLEVLKSYRIESQVQDTRMNELDFVKNLYCVVLCHCIHFIKGGWQHLEETVNFLLALCEEDCMSYRFFLRDIYEDLIQRLIDSAAAENIFGSQPCRDNALYFLKLLDEMLISEVDLKLPFPASYSDFSPALIELESQKDISSALFDVLQGEPDASMSRDAWAQKQQDADDHEKIEDQWWNLYDKIWIIISEMNGKGPSKMLSRSSSAAVPSFGQRARGLVESLNIPAAEMAAVVVSGGISNALVGKPHKAGDKAMLLRGEKCPRIAFRLIILYLCKSSLGRASRCVQQIIPLLPCLLAADDDQSKNRLQLFIWALLTVRSQYGMRDDGARFHVISHLIRETVNCGKSVLANSMSGRDDSSDLGINSKEGSALQSLIQKDRVLTAVADELKYIKNSTTDRARQIQELCNRKDESMTTDANQKKAFEEEIQISLDAILASDDSRRASFQLAQDEDQQIVAEKWIHTLRSLIDERGPWSANPFPNITSTHWKLDKTEDAWRRRQKLRRNYHFDESLCRPPSSTSSHEALPPTNDNRSGFGAHIPEQMKRFLLKGIHKITDEGSSEPSDSAMESTGQNVSLPESLSDKRYFDLIKESNDQKDIVQDKKDISSSTNESDNSEVLISVPCVLVTPKRKLAGRLAVRKKFLHFFGEFLVEGTGGSSVFRKLDSPGNIDHRKPDLLEGLQKQKFPKLPLDGDSEQGNAESSTGALLFNALQKRQNNIKRHRRWHICKIKAVHWTRYLLRYTAIEIFFNDSVAPIFFNFSSQKDAKDVGNLVVATRNESIYPRGYKEKTGLISFVDRRVALEMAETARESWRRREITNFEYLMILNTLAGRSYNDLTQYPVFPWVLADYSSDVLDFNKSSTFRDLTKPVGALDSKRFEVFEDRYRNFCDPDIPSFYYGSHYSSMGIVLFYLLRLEPFTALHRQLQGGKFDHADRLFHSIEGTYRNCLSNTSDVKELIPEFFYMPEFLVNSNSYQFGVKQDGEPLGDVCLPPWAKGSPEEFISKNREALESEYVSSNLHHWIDLVFGYKQRGKPAIEAANIFYYLTYEGAVDLETMEDELQRSAVEDQIANFGQTPIQIFRKKHPRRGPPIPIAHPLQFAPDSITLSSVISSTNTTPSDILYIEVFDSNVILVNEELTMSVKMWLTTQLQSGGNFTFSGSQDLFFGIGSDILSPRKIGSPRAENIDLGAQCFATLVTPSENYLISCGNWENSFQVISASDGRTVQSIRQHKDVVSCVAVTSDGSIIATGSYDTTVMVWEVVRASYERRVRNAAIEIPRKDYVIAETPFHILCGHDDVITCLYASAELDIVISGSKDGTCVFHTLREGRYVRSLQHPSGSSLSKLVVSRHGRLVLYADDDLSLHLYSVNGKHIATSESNGRLICLELSSCGEFLVCAGDQGQIVVRSMGSLEIVKRYSGIGKVITALTVTPEECFLAGTKDGNLLVYSIENPQLKKAGTQRNFKSKAFVT